MRLYRRDDSGPPVADIQDRLAALGYSCVPDPVGEFREATTGAVQRFQQSRGLGADGIVGPDTWRHLVEAGYRFGDRLLFYRRPMLRGDDVWELQQRLNKLGFDAGKEDGIFGPDTQHALVEFQQNRGLAEDGRAGPVVHRELALVGRILSDRGREDLRQQEWLRSRPQTVAGLRVYLDPGCRDAAESQAAWEAVRGAAAAFRGLGATPVLSRAADVRPGDSLRARRANSLGVDIVIGFAYPRGDDPAVMYFSSDRTRSEVGVELAKVVGDHVGLDPAGRVTSLLRETRAPAICVATPDLTAEVGRATAEAVAGVFQPSAAE